MPEEKILGTDYFEVFLGYWKRYHYQLALEGIPAMRTATLVSYGESAMTDAVAKLYGDFGCDLSPEEFKVAKQPKFSQKEKAKADRIIKDVGQFWGSLGLEFPANEISAMH